VCAAQLLEKSKLPGLYRIHDTPREQKLTALREFLGELGLGLGGGESPSPQDMQKVLGSIAERPDRHVIQTVMLRSMNQAVYDPENIGHFGLNYPAYTHFTSPIRRYPDLLTHRAIRHLLRSKKRVGGLKRVQGAPLLTADKIYPYDIAAMVEAGEHCSLTERRADEATREVVSWLKCEYLQEHVGDEMDGVVSAVTNFGLFVELQDIYIEGLVHITNLPQDYYNHDPSHHRLVGERTRRVYRLGDRLRVKVIRVALDERKIDFELVESKAS
ncbi:MAG: RNB domain-containing ribonuclease, partial [Porticoccaceae bacterium]|nr:RNB domain-containing ribonuclease [Porticoccaceae bacterium]